MLVPQPGKEIKPLLPLALHIQSVKELHGSVMPLDAVFKMWMFWIQPPAALHTSLKEARLLVKWVFMKNQAKYHSAQSQHIPYREKINPQATAFINHLKRCKLVCVYCVLLTRSQYVSKLLDMRFQSPQLCFQATKPPDWASDCRPVC